MALGAVTGTNTVPPRTQAGLEYTAVGTYTIGAAVAQNDTITFTGLIPKGAQVLGVTYESNELDTNASPTATVTVGTAASAAAYISAVSVGLAAAGATHVFVGANVVAGLGGDAVTAATDVVVTYPAAFATAASSGVVVVTVRYYCKNA